MRTAILAACTLNQWAMDFSGNYFRILESIKQAKLKGATYRTGPELEITGYGCNDHFHESDTLLHSWEVLVKLLNDSACNNIIVDVGMPVMHKNIIYNCRVLFLNKKILLIRPKMKLCDNGMYRESRWFTAWAKEKTVEDYVLPLFVQKATNQRFIPIGDAVLSTLDTSIGFEICEELWNPQSSHISCADDGVEIIVNSSGGFHEIGKLSSAVQMIQSATAKCGGLYLFSNLRGCDGDRIYYHGTSHVTLNGQILAMGKQFSLKEVEVVVACLDLDDIIQYRGQIRGLSMSKNVYPRIDVDFSLSCANIFPQIPLKKVKPPFYQPGEDLTLGPACWLWDYLRRSSSNGFILSLDDDIGSVSSATIVFSLCNLVYNSILEGDSSVLADLRRIIGDPAYLPTSPKELCNVLLVTCYTQGDEESPLKSTYFNDFILEIGAYHFTVQLELVINAIFTIFYILTQIVIKKGNSHEEDSAYYSVKSRIKNIVMYLMAEMLLWSKGRPGKLLVLGTGCAETSLLGKFVKHGDHYGDVSVTAGISRQELKRFLKYSMHAFKINSLEKFVNSPTEPKIVEDVDETSQEIDEVEMFSRLRREGYGPFSAFCKLCSDIPSTDSLHKTADRVKRFFKVYSISRPKILSLPPSYHVDPLAASNPYLDQRQILYNCTWAWQFNSIERELSRGNISKFMSSYIQGFIAKNMNVP